MSLIEQHVMLSICRHTYFWKDVGESVHGGHLREEGLVIGWAWCD